VSYTVFNRNVNFGPRNGLEGPFHFINGAVLYYDPKEGQYWNPLTDFYVSNEEVNELHELMIKSIKSS
jgi:hypothetical protein